MVHSHRAIPRRDSDNEGMKAWLLAAAGMATMLTLLGCNVTGLSNQPRATFSQLACLDTNGDHRLNDADAVDPSKVPDFNGDRKRNDADAAFLRGIDIPLDPARAQGACATGSGDAPEYAVAHGYFEPSNVSCAKPTDKAVLLVGIGGGAVDVKRKQDAAGVRSMIDGLQKAYDDRGVQTIGVLSGPAMVGGANIHSAMEDWMTHAVRVYLDRYPCLRVVLLGHSHGAVTADVIASRLEPQYAARIIEVVDVDRVALLYIGDTQSRPRQVRVFNIFETNDAVLKGAPYDAPNATNWDAGDEQGPRDGDKGGPLAPVNHTTIDNSDSVKRRVIAEVMARS
jgi:hypothetical protein